MSTEEQAINWWASSARTEWRKHFDAVPYWRRLLLCLLSFKKWRLAVSLGESAVFCLYGGHDSLFDRLVLLADTQWAHVLGLPIPNPTPAQRDGE